MCLHNSSNINSKSINNQSTNYVYRSSWSGKLQNGTTQKRKLHKIKQKLTWFLVRRRAVACHGLPEAEINRANYRQARKVRKKTDGRIIYRREGHSKWNDIELPLLVLTILINYNERGPLSVSTFNPLHWKFAVCLAVYPVTDFCSYCCSLISGEILSQVTVWWLQQSNTNSSYMLSFICW